MRRWVALMCVAALFASACGGPRVELEVGIKKLPSDVLLGAQETPAPPVVIPAPVRESRVLFPDVIAPVTPPVVRPGVSPTPVPICPDANPFSARPVISPATIKPLPAAATYNYRTSVTQSEETTNLTTTRTIQNIRKDVSASSTGFTFDEKILAGDRTVTRHFHVIDQVYEEPVVPNQVPAQNRPSFPRPTGLYLTGSDTVQGSSTKTVTYSGPGIQFMSFPSEPQGPTQGWNGQATDANSGDVYNYTGRTIGKQEGVDACGTVLDAWKVELSITRAPASGGSTTVDRTIHVASGYGGVIVKELEKASSGTATVTSSFTINSEPKAGVAR